MLSLRHFSKSLMHNKDAFFDQKYNENSNIENMITI